MSVTEIVGGAVGEWSVQLKANTPKEILDRLAYFGHVVITPSPVNPTRYGDSLFDECRYSGVLRSRSFRVGAKDIGGPGMGFWIGDEDDRGDVIEDEIAFTDQSYTSVITALLPSTVTIGTIHGQTGLHTQKYKLTGRRAALDYVSGLYQTEWRVRGKAVFDAGRPDQLYPTTPTCAIVREMPAGGVDTDGLRALPGNSEIEADMDDFSTRVVTVGEGNGLTVAVGTADIDDIAPGGNPFLDLQGNPLQLVRLVSEQNTSLINADARAQVHLRPYVTPREGIKLSTATHDVRGDLQVGSYVWVQDHEARIIGAEMIVFKGERLYPLKLRVAELDWPIEAGMGVAYRHYDGTWLDLTPYVEFEEGDTTIKVGAYDRALTSGTTPNDPIAGQVTVDTSVPSVPEFNTPFDTRTYISEMDGLSRAEFDVSWDTPLNAGVGTVVADGSHYTIRFRRLGA